MYAFIQYINRLFDPLIEVTQNFSTLQTSMVSAGRVFALIDERTYEPEQRDTAAKVTEGNIRFENVSFSYDASTRFWIIFPSLSIKVKPSPLWDLQALENPLLSTCSCDSMSSNQDEFS